MTSIVEVGLGFMLLLAGRPAYWFFVGSMAFLIGGSFANQFVLFSSAWNGLFLALFFGIVGVLLTFLFHRWTAMAAGFVAGGFLLYNIPIALGAESYLSSPLLFAIAGLVAMGLLLISFDFMLVVISAFTGVTLILRSFRLSGLDQGVMFMILIIFSLITQYLIMQYAKPSPD
jgi:hypothetical protein